MKLLLYKKNLIYLVLLFIIFFFLTFRDFLDTLKFFLFHSYNFKMLPMDSYYKILIDYGNGDYSSIGSPWANRFIPNYINFIYYKYFPCVEVSVIPQAIDSKVYCSMFSISLVNHIFTILSQFLLFIYLRFNLKRELSECLFGFCISYFFFQFLDRFGVDRFSIFFLLIFITTINLKKKFGLLIIIMSIWVNDKCLIFISAYYSVLLIDSYIDKRKFSYVLENIICYLSIFFYVFFIFSFDNLKNDSAAPINFVFDLYTLQQYFAGFFSFHSISNSLAQILLTILPFIILFNKKEILEYFNLKRIYFLILILFLILGILVGGTGNTGRYMIFTFPISFPIFNFLFFQLFKKF